MTGESQPTNKTFFYIKRVISVLLLLSLAAVFILSAIGKTATANAFDNFQWTFLDLGINNVVVAGVLARLVIGFEVLLSLFLLGHIYLKNFTYPAVIAMLSLFIIYLLIILAKHGNTGSCGCFGDIDQVRPLTELWHNAILIVVTIVLIYIYPIKPYKNQEWISIVAGMAAIVLPFVLMPLDTSPDPVITSQPIDMSALYAPGAPSPEIDLRKGKHIVAFMSLTCPHCKKAAYLLHIIYQDHPQYPIYLILNGPESEENNFFKETHASGVPHFYFKNTPQFIKMAGLSVPAIYWINNGVAERTSTYYQLDPVHMQQWLK